MCVCVCCLCLKSTLENQPLAASFFVFLIRNLVPPRARDQSRPTHPPPPPLRSLSLSLCNHTPSELSLVKSPRLSFVKVYPTGKISTPFFTFPSASFFYIYIYIATVQESLIVIVARSSTFTTFQLKPARDFIYTFYYSRFFKKKKKTLYLLFNRNNCPSFCYTALLTLLL